jgi:hypothetical protein
MSHGDVRAFEGRVMSRPRLFGIAAVLATALFVTVYAAPAAAAPCTTPNVLSGSSFEIDVDANLKVDGASPCIDWLTGGSGSLRRAGVLAKDDKPSGGGDDSFGQGTSEDDADPTIVDGSIPNSKSDLKVFGLYSELGTATPANPTGKFLELFWSRVQDPSGTTNMDFELNQKYCSGSTSDPNCADNSVPTPETPVRTVGDKLITYDLSQGGTVATISIRTWQGSAWGPATEISGGSQPLAVGSVNTSTIASGDSGGLGSLDPYTFGEAAVALSALFPGPTCGTFGSAYLKSRSSASFSSEVKDFVSPERVLISSCAPSITTKLSASTITAGQSVHDSATLKGATINAGGKVTYTVYTDSNCTSFFANAGTKTVTNATVPNSNNVTFNSAGTYYWQASYSGDPSNQPVKSACTSERLVVAKKQPAISTTPQPGSATVGATLNDSAALSGGLNPTGTIFFRLYGPNNPTCATSGAAPVFSQVVNVSGNGTYSTTGGFATGQAGTYHWTARYGGDANNKPAASACADEAVVVAKATSGITTAQSLLPNDTATVTGQSPTGSVDFSLFSPADPTCSGTPAFAETAGLNGSGQASTSNTSFVMNQAGTWRWLVEYGGDSNNGGATSACGVERFTIVNGG